MAAKGPKQTPEEAAAPQPPQIIPNESASTESLVDVDSQSVRTVPSDFMEQSIQTDTQADRVEREEQAEKDKADAKKKAKEAKDKAAAKARQVDGWLTKQLRSLTDSQSQALVGANVVAVVGLSGFLTYKAWGLYEKGRFSWQTAGIGAAIVGAVGLSQSIFAGYFSKARKQ